MGTVKLVVLGSINADHILNVKHFLSRVKPLEAIITSCIWGKAPTKLQQVAKANVYCLCW